MFGKPQLSPELLMSLGGGIMSGQNLAQGLGQGFQQASNIMAVQKQEREIKEGENKTRAFVQKMFPNEDVSNMPPDVLKTYAAEAIKSKFADPKKPNLISTRSGIYDADNKQWITPPAGTIDGNSVDYSLNPIWGKDANGNLVIGTLGKDGSFKQVDLPEGFEPQPGTSTVDLGTSVVVRNNKTGDTVREMPKDIAGVEELKIDGKVKGEIKSALPSARHTAKIVADEIKAIVEDPALPQALGPVESRLPTMREATARVESRIDKLAGQSFLQAREMLRGGGQITDFEGKRAEAAMVRLNRAQTPEDFKAALYEFNDAVAEGIRKLEAAADGRVYDPYATSSDGLNTTKTGIRWRQK